MSLTKEQEIELIENVKSITDRMDMVDRVFKAKGMGEKLVVAFRCNHSGLYYPGDYLREWGRKYGIGLGGTPVSECLDTDYYANLPEYGSASGVRSPDQISYPVNVSFASLDHELVSVEYMENHTLIAALDDLDMFKRMAVILPKQMKNIKSNLAFARSKTGRN